MARAQSAATLTDLAVAAASRLRNLPLLLHNLGERYRRAGRAGDVERARQATLSRFDDPGCEGILLSHQDMTRQQTKRQTT